MAGNTGRPRDRGSAEWMTVRECADLLQVTQQAIRNRIKAGTIDYEQHIENGRASYRIRRAAVEEEAARGGEGATSGEVRERASEVLVAFERGVETIRREVEKQHTQLAPLQEKQLENQARILEEVQGLNNSLDEFYRLARGLNARLKERERLEKEYQQKNLELQQQTLDLLLRVDSAEKERTERGMRERRSFWRRLFSPGHSS